MLSLHSNEFVEFLYFVSPYPFLLFSSLLSSSPRPLPFFTSSFSCLSFTIFPLHHILQLSLLCLTFFFPLIHHILLFSLPHFFFTISFSPLHHFSHHPYTGVVRPSNGPSDLLLKPWACKQCNIIIATETAPARDPPPREASFIPTEHPDVKKFPKTEKARFFSRFLPSKKLSIATATEMPHSAV